MVTIDRFVKILSPVNIYNLDKNSNIYKELLVYAEEIDLLIAELNKLLEEEFLDTATDYGLSNIEHIYTEPYSNETPEIRSSKILQRLLISDNDFTLPAIINSIKSFGAKDFQIIEYPQRYNIVVEIKGDYQQSDIDFIKAEIRKIMPAHQNVEVYFNGLSWQEIDSKNLTFSSMDLKNYSWETIDELKL